MKSVNCSKSVCGRCGYYRIQGQRGGYCQQLGVEVKSKWKACPFASPTFASALENQDIPCLERLGY